MNERLKAFSDGVFAIAITLLILDIKVPPADIIHSPNDVLRALAANWTQWFAFLLSFLSMFIAWVNHNHTLKQIDKSSPAFFYANGFLMLTVIIYPFATSLLAQYLNTPYSRWPVFFYCFINTIHAFAWVVVYHSALNPVGLTRDEVRHKRLVDGRRNIMYTVYFNIAMCAVSFWLPVLAVTLTALAWLVYLIMGLILTPAD